MKTKTKVFFYSLVFTILSITFYSCGAQNESQLMDLTISLKSSAKTAQSRNISPSNDELSVFKFVISGIGPSEKTFEAETTNESTQLSNLVKGKWDISVIGYNINDEAIVEGSGTYYLFNSQSIVNITLEYINGTGNIDLDFYWNPDQVDADKVGVLTTYYKLNNNTFTECSITDTINYEIGHATISAPIESGNYIISSKLYSGPTELSGFAEQLRILANHTTEGSNTFVIGDTTLNYGINFYCNTHLPIIGVINSTPETIVVNQELTLSFTPTSIPEGYDESDINYSWYYEGDLISGENTNVLTILPVKGEHRYDLFAYIDGISGTLGSTKIIITCSEQ